MNISKTAWHYKFINTMKSSHEGMPTTVCQYVWKLLFNLAQCFFIIAMLFIVGFVIGDTLLSSLFDYASETWYFSPLYALLGVIILAIIIIIGVSVVAGIGYLLDKMKNSENVITKYVKERKSKCSAITYKDKE